MANIFVILHGQPSYADLCGMTLADISAWHQRAVDRAPKRDGNG